MWFSICNSCLFVLFFIGLNGEFIMVTENCYNYYFIFLFLFEGGAGLNDTLFTSHRYANALELNFYLESFQIDRVIGTII